MTNFKELSYGCQSKLHCPFTGIMAGNAWQNVSLCCAGSVRDHMVKILKIAIVIFASLLLQMTILPAYVADPFKPNLFIVIVCYLGLRESVRIGGGCLAFLLGLLQDTFSGIYLGLSGFSYLCIYLLLRHVAGRLYTNSRYLMVLVVFLASVINGLLHLVLLLLYPAANGIYVTLLSGLIPQGLVNALIASLIFSFPKFNMIEESR